MKTFLNIIGVLLLFAVAPVFAGTPEMVAQCEEVMRCELCRVANDTSNPGATKWITYKDAQGASRAREVLARDYDYIRNTGYAKNKAGKFLMCQRVAEVMKKPDSLRAQGARAMFNADWKQDRYCP